MDRRGGRPKGGGRSPAEAQRALLDAAEHTFTALGLAASTMAKVAQAAGMSRATLYTHFRTRDDLVTGLAARVLEGHRRTVGERIERIDDPAEALVEVLVYVATTIAHDPVLQLLASSLAEGETFAALLESSPELSAILGGFYAEAIVDFGGHDLRPGLAPDDAVRFVFGTSTAMVLGAWPGSDDARTARAFVTTFVLPALFVGTPPPQPVWDSPANE